MALQGDPRLAGLPVPPREDTHVAGRMAPQPVSDYELATRLSYFLWASMPDDELRRLAASAPAARARRAARAGHAHAAGPASRRRWSSSSAGSGCRSRALESAEPDPDKFPDFEDYLRLSMRQETELFFATIIREDRSILDFLDAKYSFVNERLARHYGICRGRWARSSGASICTDTAREGVLTQASVLTVSSYATRTSPVLRGKWVLENLLNAAPPPIRPPTVPRLDESAVGSHDDAAPADGSAPQEPDVRVLPPPDGPARLRPRELRRASASGGPRTASSRSTPPGSSPTAGSSQAPRSWARSWKQEPRRLRARRSRPSC